MFVRPRSLVAVARRDSYLFVVPDRPEPIALDGVDVELFARLLARAATPISRDDLLGECDEATLTTLVDLGILIAAEPAPAPSSAVRKRRKTIVIGLSAAVGVAGALEHVIAIADHFAERVELIVSQNATSFISPRLYEYYGLRVWTDAFTPAHGAAVPHEHLAAAAELVLIAPASAGMLHKLATGACNDLISLTVSATRAPVVIAPSMNPQMWLHPPIARNVAQLRADGMWIVDPGVGFLVAARDQRGVGGAGYDPAGLLRALDAVLAHQERAVPARLDG